MKAGRKCEGMKNSDRAAARLEHDRALEKVVIGMLADHTELFKQFSDNPSFKKWLADTIFGVTYQGAASWSIVRAETPQGPTPGREHL